MKNMISITKAESGRVREVYPRAEIVRTCIQKSKRHRYYLPESERYLRVIADTNSAAASICRQIDRNRERRRKYRN